MQTSRKFLTILLKVAVCATLALGFTAEAQDKKADPTGTWTWTSPGRNGGPERKSTLKLKLDGDKLTGMYMSTGGGQGKGGGGGGGGETAITDAKITGEDVSFSVTREFGGNKVTTKYMGKIAGDSIKGKTESERDGQKQSRDWEAKREAAK